MTLRASVTALCFLLLSAGLMFHFFQTRLTGPLLAFGANPEVLDQLEASLADQRRLATSDPDNEPFYHQRFDTTRTLVHRLQILEHSRGAIERRYDQILLLVFAGTVLVVVGGVVLRQSRHESRLSRLQTALADLAGGRTDIEIGERRRDVIGRIATMIERTSRIMARDRRRLAALENLSAWQESARRHAHEMRTPLTGARLELSRLDDLLAGEPLARPDEVHEATRSVMQELERLGRFTQEFTSFARVPRPRLEIQDLAGLAEEFVQTFEAAWPNVSLRTVSLKNVSLKNVSLKNVSLKNVPLKNAPPRAEAPAPASEGYQAALDRDMVRRVLVNLCDNSALALGERRGTVMLSLAADAEHVHLDVTDDGPGVAERIRPRMFEPYTTTRSIGHGMGLGLAISKKILLDHDGDLELRASSPAGATFRLTFRRRLPEENE